VFASVSGWGEAGPYRDLGSHGLAFDAFAGLAPPRDVDGRPARPSGHVWQGLEAAPLYAALAIVAAVLRARTSGEPCRLEISEADTAAAWNMWRISYEAVKATNADAGERTDGDHTEMETALNAAAEGAGATGTDDRPGSDVRYQYYASSDGYVLLMATETRFWENFCGAVGRMDLFERWPGQRPVDHDYGNDALRDELARIFAARTRAEWVQLFIDADVAGAPVYLSGETHRDPHFAARGLWLDADVHGVSLLAPPVRADGAIAVSGRAAPQHAADHDEVLRDVLGYDDARIEVLRAAGAFGSVR
jgi:crotonobetainyl-CoA:carnitine CoA-transferase CaiB-like acyl-CoA transferase